MRRDGRMQAPCRLLAFETKIGGPLPSRRRRRMLNPLQRQRDREDGYLVLPGFKPLHEIDALRRVRVALGDAAGRPGPLADALAELLFVDEVDATRVRVDELLATRVFPGPNPDWPAIPWPPI